MQVEKKKAAFRFEDKRFALPFVVVVACPECGADVRRDLEDWALSYPPLDEPFDLDFCCGDGCEHEWPERVRLTVTLEVDTPWLRSHE